MLCSNDFEHYKECIVLVRPCNQTSNGYCALARLPVDCIQPGTHSNNIFHIIHPISHIYYFCYISTPSFYISYIDPVSKKTVLYQLYSYKWKVSLGLRSNLCDTSAKFAQTFYYSPCCLNPA